MYLESMFPLSSIISRTLMAVWKRRNDVFVVICMLFLFSTVTIDTSAQTTTTETEDFTQHNISRVGIIDISSVLRASKATEKVRVLLDGKREEFQREFSVKETELLSREKDLQSKRQLMSDNAYRDEVQKFQDEVAEIQRQIQFRRQSLDNAFQQAQDKIRELTLTIVTEVANERRLDMVLTKDTVLVFRNMLDITEIVLQRLNERTKNARLELDDVTPKSDGG